MKQKSLFLSGFTLLFLAVSTLAVSAGPSEEISRAVSDAGATNVKRADKATFLRGYQAVLSQTKNAQLPGYVTAAIRLRPDLAPDLTAATVSTWARRGHDSDGKEILSDKEISCDQIDQIIRAAILADPDATDAIVRAAIQAAPYARECILAAANQPEAPGEGPTTVVSNRGFGGPGSIGTINPSNIGGGGVGTGGQGGVVSRAQP